MADYLLHALVTLLVTIDPIGLAPIFVSLTSGMTPLQRRQTGVRATITSAAILFAFALVGHRLIGLLGISIPAFRIAGGLLLFSTAFEMVFERRDKRKAETAGRALQGQLTDSRAASLDDDDVRRLAVFPLAIPLIAGPGAISATILIASGAPGPLATAGLLAIIAGLILSCLVAFLLAGRLDRLLGETGRVVLSRLLGVLLAALSVQFVADGVVALAKSAGMVAGH